jgi:UDP-glucose 4-epimerase
LTQRAIVTGGAGFIGSHMVDLLLDRGFQVAVIDNLKTGRITNLEHHKAEPRLEVHTVDMATLPSDSPIFKDTEYVFHFGGLGDIVPSIERPLDYTHSNITGTLAVLEASRQAGVKKLVYAASSSCYGANPQVPTPEDAKIQPEYPYAFSKWAGEEAVFHWGKVYGLPVASIRMFNVYGPRVRTTGVYGAVFGVFLAQKLHGKPLTVVGDGTQTRDFVYVTDVCRAFLLAAESDVTGEVYNLGAGNPQPILKLAHLIGGEITHLPKRPGEPDCTWADISKIQRTLDWSTTVSFEEGVANMLQHIEHWADAPVWDPASIAEATKTWFQFLTR